MKRWKIKVTPKIWFFSISYQTIISTSVSTKSKIKGLPFEFDIILFVMYFNFVLKCNCMLCKMIIWKYRNEVNARILEKFCTKRKDFSCFPLCLENTYMPRTKKNFNKFIDKKQARWYIRTDDDEWTKNFHIEIIKRIINILMRDLFLVTKNKMSSIILSHPYGNITTYRTYVYLYHGQSIIHKQEKTCVVCVWVILFFVVGVDFSHKIG